MNQYLDLYNRLCGVLKEENIAKDELMSKHTSFKVGGPVDLLLMPETVEQVIEIVKICKEEEVPFYVIGNGSNLLVKDGGIRGVAIKLNKLNKIEIKGEKLTCECGAELYNISKAALEAKLTGFEFASGIPGSVGGAVAMNAGAYNGEIADVIESATVIDNKNNTIVLDKEGLELGYRMSSILKNDYVVLRVVLKLKQGEYDLINNRIEDLNRRRSERQPLEFPSAGSTFKRPEGHFAAKLIEDSGLKGVSVGGAEVSKKHSGFIINKGNATAKDILDLIGLVQKTVKEKFDVELFTEVRIMGEDKLT